MLTKYWLRQLLKWTLIFLAFFACLFFWCSYSLCYRESLATFYYDSLTLGQVTTVDGIFGWMALFVTQFFVSRLLAAVVMALLFTVLFKLLSDIFQCVFRQSDVGYLALVPCAFLVGKLSHPDYDLSAFMAFFAIVLIVRFCLAILSPKTFSKCLRNRRSTTPKTARRPNYLSIAVYGLTAISCLCILLWQIRPDHRSAISVEYDKGDWYSVIHHCQNADTLDAFVDNYRNLALAHRGRLASDMLRYDCHGPSSLIMRGRSPEDFVVLSDVYYGIGLLSAAQFYAFQANEAYGNLSPRLLKRLADISLAYGQYAVAKKYIDILSNTLFYRSWAEDRRALLYDDQAVSQHPEISQKRASIFPDNRFIAQRGVDDDIWQVLQANPSNQMAFQYLGCFYILAKDMPRFMKMIDSLDSLSALPDNLPVLFQQAICTAALAADQPVHERYGIAPQVLDECRYFWTQARRPAPGTTWSYLRFGVID